MRKREIENWALKVIEQANAGHPSEDFTVELKSSWPEDYNKAARQIAGHANAARGDNVLWLIGVDQDKGVTGAAYEEFADWYAKVEKEFSGLAPRAIDVNVPSNDVTVVALLLETDRAPFVVRDYRYGTERGHVQWEVPWREGTSTRSATREDLLKLLTPVQKIPDYDILDGEIKATNVAIKPGTGKDKLNWHLRIDLYVYPKTESPIVMPFHKCQGRFEILGILPVTPFATITLTPPMYLDVGTRETRNLSLTIKKANDEVVVHGPGRLTLHGHAQTAYYENLDTARIQSTIEVRPAYTNIPLTLQLTMTSAHSADPKEQVWRVQ